MDYAKAAAMLRTARRMEDGKPIDHNTRLFQRGDHVAVRLHNTDIILFYPDGRVTLNTGGWKTVTTKDRINGFSPFSVWQKKGTWFVTVNGVDYSYKDGMTISASGDVTGADSMDAFKREQEIRKQAKAYAKGFVNALFAGNVPLPGGGDCFICSLARSSKDHNYSDASHLISHMEERYYVPTLMVNAMQEFGASQVARMVAQEKMQSAKPVKTLSDALAHSPGKLTSMDEIGADQIRTCIRRYVLRKLGLSS